VADRIIDPSTFSIPALALELEGHSTRFALASNVYGDNMEFLVRVLAPPMPMGRFEQNAIYRFMRTGGRAQTAAEAAAAVLAREMSGSTSDIPFSFQGRILGEPGRPSPHSFLPDPCSIDSAQNKLKAVQLITLHTNFRSPAGYTGPVPRMGDIVKVSLDAGSQGSFSLQKAFFKTLERKKDVVQDAQDSQESCTSLQGLPWGEAASGAASTPAESRRLTLAEVDAIAPAGEMVVSQLSAAAKTKLTSLVNTEKGHWNGRTESEAGESPSQPNTNSIVYKRLKIYWAAMLLSHSPGIYTTAAQAGAVAERDWIFFPSGDSRGKTQAWSAAYISYIMYLTMAQESGKSADHWRGSSAHHYYMTEGKRKGWKVYDLASNAGGKIKADIGDILLTIYDRAAARDTPSSHGDVVYKIENSKAYLSGGNVSDTVTTSKNVALDSNGCYKTDATSRNGGYPRPYIVVMKYNPKTEVLPADGS